MKRKKFLFIYHVGARGDFLASILIGDVLKTSVGMPWVRYTGTDLTQHFKIHNIKDDAASSIITSAITDFSDYHTIRIKFENLQDCKDAFKLASTKLIDRNFVSAIEAYLEFEKTSSQFDHTYNKIVPFKDLFNMEKISLLFEQYRNRKLTAEEETRIKDNIDLNLSLLNRTTILG